MPSISYGVSLGSIKASVTRSSDTLINTEVALPAGKSGTLSTRTDNDTGVVTVSSGHGITDTDTVDVYWTGGKRYNVDVTATTSTTISIDAGSGDNLPSAATAVTIVKQVAFNVLIDGDNCAIMGLMLLVSDSAATGVSYVQFKDSGASVVSSFALTANVPNINDITGGQTNAYTGAIIYSGVASNSDTTNAATLQIQGVMDSTP